MGDIDNETMKLIAQGEPAYSIEQGKYRNYVADFGDLGKFAFSLNMVQIDNVEWLNVIHEVIRTEELAFFDAYSLYDGNFEVSQTGSSSMTVIPFDLYGIVPKDNNRYYLNKQGLSLLWGKILGLHGSGSGSGSGGQDPGPGSIGETQECYDVLFEGQAPMTTNGAFLSIQNMSKYDIVCAFVTPLYFSSKVIYPGSGIKTYDRLLIPYPMNEKNNLQVVTLEYDFDTRGISASMPPFW